MLRTRTALQLTLSLTLLLGPSINTAVQAESPAFAPRGDLGGLWFDPDNAGQGLQIDILDHGLATVAWYTFDRDGAPLWLVGEGEVVDDGVRVVVGQASGGRFPSLPARPSEYQRRGELNIRFVDCEQAELVYDDDSDSSDGLGHAEVSLRRLTRPGGARCGAAAAFMERRSFSFQHGSAGFTALFADLPVEGQEIYELDARHASVPAPLASFAGVRLSGHNRSDDLAMLIKAPIQGLLADTDYRLELQAEIASNVPFGCAGVGGAPGESVYLKLGASSEEPQAVAVDEGAERFFRLNIDYGVQAQPGTAARVVGDLATRQPCEVELPQWQLKTLSSAGQELQARSDSNGRLWLLAGSDSAFEGYSEFYWLSLEVRLQPLPALP